jgi:VanZ family protein
MTDRAPSPSYPLWLRILSWVGVGIWAATIYYFSSLTGPEIAQIGITFWDKAEHFIAFFSGAVALVLALRFSTQWPWRGIILCAAALLCAYGAADEIHQLFTPNRSGADPLDWLADTLGGATGTLVTSWIYARFQRTHRRPSA